MMTPALVARLRVVTQDYATRNSRNGSVKFSDVITHVCNSGFQLADREMFAEWCRSNVSGRIAYDQ